LELLDVRDILPSSKISDQNTELQPQQTCFYVVHTPNIPKYTKYEISFIRYEL